MSFLISEIFNDHNEVHFRNLESKYLKTISQKKEKKVISLGGGTPCFETNIEIINKSFSRLICSNLMPFWHLAFSSSSAAYSMSRSL